jgi:hypothetical protein
MAFLAGLAICWLGLVAYMTSDGFSGNQRYLIAPVALLIVLSGAGAGWGLERIIELAGRAIPALARKHQAHALVAVAAAAIGVGFMVPSVQNFAPTMRNLKYQADLADEVGGLVRDAGGAERLKACGKPFTGPFLVPVVAWNLRVHTQDVSLRPTRPAVVFRVKTTATSHPVPSLRGIGAGTTVATGSKWRIVTACGSPTA